MTMEDLEPRPRQGAALADLTREDLDPYSVGDLKARIETLEAEIERSRQAITRKDAKKSAADALFSFKS